ncbi:prephenate dehydratase [Candidatus Peregrinibacteria bacterium]|nr:prephenate dehydratase [Candidatus Peregrinibacteria bacterium]
MLKNDKSREIAKSLKHPKKSDLALLGPKNTFSDLAAADIKMPKYYARDIEEVFSVVEQGRVNKGLVPIENKLQGSVRETMDALFTSKVHITNEIRLPIHHCLITHKHTKKEDIRKVISHYQALGQCKKYLRRNFPKAEIQTTTSTAAAIEKLNSANNHIAVIAPEIAATSGESAQNNHLKIFAKNIEDSKDNETIFVVIEKGELDFADTMTQSKSQIFSWEKYPRGHFLTDIMASQSASSKTAALPQSTTAVIPKTSIAFYFSHDKSGSLFTIFKIFKDAKINMTKVESRPTQVKFGQYIFYLDFEGHISEPKIQKALSQIATSVAKLKILGSY